MSSPLTAIQSKHEEIADRLCQRIRAHYSANELHTLLREHADAAAMDQSFSCQRLTNEEALRHIVDHHLEHMSIRHSRFLRQIATFAVPASLGLAFGGRFENHVRLLGSANSLERLCQRGTVVLACTHSSNLDGLVVGAGLVQARVPPFVYPAGKHLYRNRWVARLITSLGGYQLDRSLTAPLYKQLVVEYFAALVEEGCHSLIFPSGTRSRTGRVEGRLKLGLLGSIQKALRYRHRRGDERPIFVVPVTINHLVVPEARILMHYALSGKESERVVGDEMRNQGGAVALAKRAHRFEQRTSLCFGEALHPTIGEDEGEDDDRTQALGEDLAAALRQGIRFQSTQVVARALCDLLLATIGSGPDENEALLASTPAQRQFARAAVLRQIDATRQLLLQHPTGGSLMDVAATASPEALLEESTQVWQRCHREGVLRSGGAQVHILDVPLLLYYRNRSAHITGPPG